MNFINAPKNTTLSIEVLYQDYIKNMLISPVVMEDFRKKLIAYYKEENPTFFIRQVKAKERGLIYKNDVGHRIKPTDNSPSWWLHYQLFNDKIGEFDNFIEFLAGIPSHMFDIKLKGHVNHAGWHVSHIFNAKDYETDDSTWDKDELIKRTFRNIHPCNYFNLPKTNWRQNGGNEDVISYFYDKFKKKYGSVFEEFEAIVNPEQKKFTNSNETILIYTTNSQTEIKFELGQKKSPKMSKVLKSKSTPRLAFHAAEIEVLKGSDHFDIETHLGTFRMTKEEFHSTFSNVIKSSSYQIKELYHYPEIPKKAMQYLIEK